MEKYGLSSDPCDYMLIQCTNLLSCLACACTVMAAIGVPGATYGAAVIDVIAAIVYGAVSGCMTAQVSTVYLSVLYEKHLGKLTPLMYVIMHRLHTR